MSLEILSVFLRLGCTSFGGPIAHLGYFRTELVERVRKEIAAGTYDTPEKWEAALDRLLDRLAED